MPEIISFSWKVRARANRLPDQIGQTQMVERAASQL
jgi:hypothetical protein